MTATFAPEPLACAGAAHGTPCALALGEGTVLRAARAAAMVEEADLELK